MKFNKIDENTLFNFKLKYMLPFDIATTINDYNMHETLGHG